MATDARQITIGDLRPEHWPEVVRIYARGDRDRQRDVRDRGTELEDWDASHLDAAPLRRARRGRVVGWAAVSPVSDRCVYGGVVENSVYVAAEARGRGIGRLLLEGLIRIDRGKRASGRSRPGSSPRTTAAFVCTSSSGSRSSGVASSSASSTASGAMCFCSSGVVRPSTDARHRRHDWWHTSFFPAQRPLLLPRGEG